MNKLFLAILPFLILICACDKTESSSGNTTIQFNTTGNLQIPFIAGTDSVSYTISDPVADGKLVPSASEDWITGYNTSTEGILYFDVEENPAKEPRSAILSLTYTYNGGETSTQVNVIQDASNAIIFEASYVGGFYYADLYSEGSMRYYTWLTENPLQGNGLGAGINYCFDIYADAPENMSSIAAAPATYELDPSTSTAQWTLGARETRLVNGETAETTYFKEGSLTITKEGNTYHYAAEMIDSSGTIHRISYTGNVSLINSSNPYTSTLTEDYELQTDGASLIAYYFGQYYGETTSNWSGTLVPANGNGDAFQFDLCAPLSFDFGAGFPTGTFSINESLAENTSLNGFNDVTGADIGTWYLEWSNYNRTDRAAPIVSGTIDISKDGDVYTLELDGKDDAGNSITAHWSGIPDCSDRTGYAAPSAYSIPALPLN